MYKKSSIPISTMLSIVFGLASLLSLVNLSTAHHAIKFPISREPKTLNQWKSDPSGNTNPCENSDTTVPDGNTFGRGQSLMLEWWRNNHRGGFVRFSIAPMDASPTMDTFSAAQNIVSYQCFSNPSCVKYNEFDNGWENQCWGINDRIPTYLSDGDYVANVAFYYQYDSYGNPNQYLPIFSNCMNIRISGGDNYDPSVARTPNWDGVDLENDGQSGGCKYKGGNAFFPSNGYDPDADSHVADFNVGPPGEIGTSTQPSIANKQVVTDQAVASTTQAPPTGRTKNRLSYH